MPPCIATTHQAHGTSGRIRSEETQLHCERMLRKVQGRAEVHLIDRRADGRGAADTCVARTKAEHFATEAMDAMIVP